MRVGKGGPFLGLCLAIAFAESLFLVSPPPLKANEKALCVSTLHVGRHLNIIKDCDSKDFLRLAADPSRIFSAEKHWQSRPGFVALGWLFSQPFLAQDNAARSGFSPRLAFNPYYAGFVLLNFCLLVTAAVLFIRLARGKTELSRMSVLPGWSLGCAFPAMTI